jgi:hypothetical protein
MKIYLNVPYEEKDIAKRKGCHWDDFRKQWFITNPVNLDQYMRWMPENLLKPTKDKPLDNGVFVNTKISSDRYKRLMKMRQRKTRR